MKHVLVTGASSGLGRQLAIDLSKNKYFVFITGRNEFELEKTEAAMDSEYFLGSFQADLSVSHDLAALSSAVIPDVLINCAGIFPVSTIEETDIEVYDRCFEDETKNFISAQTNGFWNIYSDFSMT